MIIEGIAASTQDVHDLNRSGADRIELCGEMDITFHKAFDALND
ncbi:hypothetical protein [Salinicoccus roseus]|nr:hypothetical protein [Salinicoccus roseus]